MHKFTQLRSICSNKRLHNCRKSVNFCSWNLKLMNLIVAFFLSEIKHCSCRLGVLDTPQFVSGVFLHTCLSGVLPHAFIFWYVHMPHVWNILNKFCFVYKVLWLLRHLLKHTMFFADFHWLIYRKGYVNETTYNNCQPCQVALVRWIFLTARQYHQLTRYSAGNVILIIKYIFHTREWVEEQPISVLCCCKVIIDRYFTT